MKENPAASTLPRSDTPTLRRARRPLAALALFLAAARIAAAAPSPRLDPDRLQAIAGHAAQALQSGLPGAVVFAGTRDGVVFRAAYGNRQVAPVAVKMELDTIFDMASCSKAVGATTGLMLMVEDGKISLDDPVSKWIPKFTGGGKEAIRIRDLATHTSGLPSYTGSGDLLKQYGPGGNPDALIDRICGLNLEYATGKKWLYSCLNFITTARCVENAAGKCLHDLDTERVYGPLGMKDTGYRLSRDQLRRAAPTRANGILTAEGKVPESVGAGPFVKDLIHDPLAHFYTNAEHCSGNAGLFATAPDLAIFLQMLVNRGTYRGKRVLKAATIDLFTRVQTPDGVGSTFGYGWDTCTGGTFCPKPGVPPDQLAVCHTGYTGTFVWADKNSGIWTTILTNRVHPADTAGPSRAVGALRAAVVRTVIDACEAYNPAVAEAFTKKPAPAPAPAGAGGDMPGENEEADRLLSRARNYRSSRLIGKAEAAYREVVAKFPGTPQAKEAAQALSELDAAGPR